MLVGCKINFKCTHAITSLMNETKSLNFSVIGILNVIRLNGSGLNGVRLFALGQMALGSDFSTEAPGGGIPPWLEFPPPGKISFPLNAIRLWHSSKPRRLTIPPTTTNLT